MSPEEQIHQWMIAEKKTLAFAESCTGGALSSQITAQAGASDYFLGSLVTYSNYLKQNVLGVLPETLLQFGAVSAETAREMLYGLFSVSDADFGIAITGIAGPTGGTSDKPVGTVWIAIGENGLDPHVEKHQFSGNRAEVIEASCQAALSALLGIF